MWVSVRIWRSSIVSTGRARDVVRWVVRRVRMMGRCIVRGGCSSQLAVMRKRIDEEEEE